MKASSLFDRRRVLLGRAAACAAVVATLVACSGAGDPGLDDDTSSAEDNEDEDGYAQTEDAFTAGPCAGTAIDRAVKCAQGKGARVLSYYRSPADQERVRRENHCRDRCAANSIGCVRPTAGCTSSPHTACRAVDLVNDGRPATRAALRACGLAKTTAPHANHYDLVR